MGALLIALFATIFVITIFYALALAWCRAAGKFTAGNFTFGKVLIGELIVVGLPSLYYLLLHHFYNEYAAKTWHDPWSGAREVIAVYLICQFIGGLVIWVREQIITQKFYEDEER